MSVRGEAERNLHEFLDLFYGAEGATQLRERLANGEDANARFGPDDETPLFVATRRRRLEAVALLLDHGADIDGTPAAGKSCYAHALRRGFVELADLLRERGANIALNEADEFALAVTRGRLDEARALLATHPGIARTGNPEEDRLLADIAGRNESEPVAFLIEAGADLSAPAMDDGTPLHQAAWFGQPANAHLLVRAGASLDVFERVHGTSPLGWAVHGSRYSGGAEEHIARYVELVELLLEAGSSLRHPKEPPGSAAYLRHLHEEAPALIAALLPPVVS